MATVAERMQASERLALASRPALALAPAAHAGGPGLVFGATEDAVRSPSLVQAKAQMDLASLAGFRAVRITEIWAPGDTAVSNTDTTILRNVAAAAKLDGMAGADDGDRATAARRHR